MSANGMDSTNYKLLQKIYGLKGDWESADKAGDKKSANQAEQSAKSVYQKLTDNGYSGVADELHGKNYSDSAQVLNYWGKQGKTGIRDYVSNLAPKYNMTTEQMNNLLSYDELTGQVSLAGQNLGSPFSEVDGRTYWDQDYLDARAPEALAKAGIYQSEDSQYREGQKDVQDRLRQNWGLTMDDHDAMNKAMMELAKYQQDTNALDTPEARSILERYDLKGLQGRDNEAAAGAAYNAGNVDSYSAAQALRKQAYLRNLGEQTALAAHQQKITGIQQTLANLGLYNEGLYNSQFNNISLGMQQNQQMYNNDQDRQNQELNRSETAKNGQVSRDVATSQVTGTVPNGMAYSDNPYFDYNGNLLNDKVDYQDIINKQDDIIQNSEDAEEVEAAKLRKRQAQAARTWKILHTPGYEQYAGEIVTEGPRQTEEGRQFDVSNQTARDVSMGEQNAALAAAQMEAETNDKALGVEVYKSDNELEGVKYQTDAKKSSSSGGSSGGSSKKSGGGSGGSSDSTKRINSFISKLNKYAISNVGTEAFVKNSSGGYDLRDGFKEMLANQLKEDTTLTDEEKLALIEAYDIPSGTLDTVTDEYDDRQKKVQSWNKARKEDA